MDLQLYTFLSLALPMFAALAALTVVIGTGYVAFRLLEWAWVHTRFWLWRRRHGR